MCDEVRFLCRDCVGYRYHYCADEYCKACVCVECDGGRSVKAICCSENKLLWERLVERGTEHFNIVNCCFEFDENTPCQSPEDLKFMRDECCDSESNPLFSCNACGSWLCVRCADVQHLAWCSICGERSCTEWCVDVWMCDTCSESFCTTCSAVKECDDGCDPLKIKDGTEYPPWPCSECYLEKHPLRATEESMSTEG